jgi:hypothetical protein
MALAGISAAVRQNTARMARRVNVGMHMINLLWALFVLLVADRIAGVISDLAQFWIAAAFDEYQRKCRASRFMAALWSRSGHFCANSTTRNVN